MSRGQLGRLRTGDSRGKQMTKVQLKPDEHGNLVVPREVLGEGTEHSVYTATREGNVLRLEPVPHKLHDVEDSEERV